MKISKTPLRVSLFGGGSDFPEFFRQHEGAVIGGAINRFIYCSVVRTLPGISSHKIRLAYGQSERVNSNSEIKHKATAEILNLLGIDESIEITVTADLPARVGLGSSSAFAVGLLNVLQSLRNARSSPQHLADTAIFVERNLLMNSCGWQDQIFSAFGGFNLIRFYKNESYTVESLGISNDELERLSAHLLMYFTGQYRDSSEVEREKFRNLSSSEKSILAIKEHVFKACDILSRGKNYDDLGKLMHETWTQKRSLTPVVSNPHIDNLYRQALAAGATGGKLLGAGSGGMLLLFCPLNRIRDVRREFSALPEIPFAFEQFGSNVSVI